WTYNHIGALQMRSLRPLPAERSQRLALEVLDALVKEDAKNPAVRHARARAYHDLSVSLFPRNRLDGVSARQKAQAILEELANEFPAVPDYRAELAELLIAFPVPGRLPFPKLGRDLEKRCSRALDLANELASKYPAVPEYQALQARCRTRLGMGQLAAG